MFSIKNLKKVINHISFLYHNQRGKLFLPLLICGLFGLILEIFMRAISGALVGHIVGISNVSYISMIGWTSLWMIPVYFTGFFFILLLNDLKQYYELPMFVQMIVGGLIIAIVELTFGLIFNVWLGFNIWYYPVLSIFHQVWLGNYILFTLSVPFAIWLIDFIEWALYGEEKLKYNMVHNYKELFKNIIKTRGE